MVKGNLAGIILLFLAMISIGQAQINNNGFDVYLKNLSLEQATDEIKSRAPGIIENVSQDLLQVNSSDIQNLSNLSSGLLNGLSICDINLIESSDPDRKPDIRLLDVRTDTGSFDLLGRHADCTFTLNNTGNGDGVAVVNFERDNGILLKKASFLVAKNTARKFNEKLDLPLLSFGQVKITCYIESQRKAKAEDCLDPYVRKN
ncbi:MAG: hypothetical protein NTU95_05795 [Methanothrix sp.]|nr:hypothetical protein [Methanothrix sp.]